MLVFEGEVISSIWFHGLNRCGKAVQDAIGWYDHSRVSITLADHYTMDYSLRVESLMRFCTEDL